MAGCGAWWYSAAASELLPELQLRGGARQQERVLAQRRGGERARVQVRGRDALGGEAQPDLKKHSDRDSDESILKHIEKYCLVKYY